MTTSDPTPLEGFVPALVWPGRRPTLTELATWHEAMRDSVGQLLPIDFFGCWLLPSRGGAMLLGPRDLDANAIAVPVAEPLVSQEALFRLEDRVRASGYGSAMAIPVRSEVQDVGLLVVARFGEEEYSLADQRTLHRVGSSVATAMRRLASQPWVTPATPSEERVPMVAGITESLLDAIDRSRTGSDLVQLASDAIGAQLPHDRLELLAVAPAPDCWALLGTEGIAGRGAGIDGADLDRVEELVYHLGAEPIVRVGDLKERQLAWPASLDRRNAERQSSLLAARMELNGELIGWLWLGSSAPGWFQAADEPVVQLVARLLASRVAAWSARHELAGAWG